MPNVVEQYWMGVLDRLRAEVDVLGTLIDHAGERGRENEIALSRILERFMPSRYGLGTGLLVDAEGGYSRQTDLLVYDKEQPALFGQTTPLLFPVETVYACIEVKTTLRSGDLDDLQVKTRAIRGLAIEEETVVFAKAGESFDFMSQPVTPPLSFAFAYRAEVSAESILRKLGEAPPDEQPDALVVLEPSLFAGRFGELFGEPDGSFVVTQVPLHAQDPDTSERIRDQFMYVENAGSLDTVTVGNRTYPLVKDPEDKNRKVVHEPARALLLFLMQVQQQVSQKRLSERPLMRRYLRGAFGDVTRVQSADTERSVSEDLS